MSGSNIGMIIRTNLVAPDIQITAGDLLDTDIEKVYQEVCDSNSEYLIDSEYLQNRYIKLCQKYFSIPKYIKSKSGEGAGEVKRVNRT